MKPTGQRGTWMFVPIASSLRGSVGSRLHVSSAGLLRAGGSAAPWRALLAIPLATLCALLAFSIAAVAQAEPPKLVSYGQFGTHEPNAAGVAVEGSGDLFVSGSVIAPYSPSTVVKLDPSGKLLSPPSPFGSAYYSGVAVNPANGDVYVLGQESIGLFTPATPTMIFVYDPNTGAPVGTPFEVPAGFLPRVHGRRRARSRTTSRARPSR